MGLHMNTLNIEGASKLLGAHRETIRRMAASGELPGVKIGRSWVFLEQDLVMYLRNKYSSCDALQGVAYRSNTKWHSTKEMESGGSISSIKEREYVKVLGLK
ncbi:helix-turn-helix domain-containing protein [Legionella bozemanae]|uniref:helix-turn-helix domain-containing protein n=2 Tax=Legionella bozemanae TaxID=447 RepID=UPI000730EEBB|nr:helix-turn-helix domain-containing protein [Legionella bozemanae]